MSNPCLDNKTSVLTSDPMCILAIDKYDLTAATSFSFNGWHRFRFYKAVPVHTLASKWNAQSNRYDFAVFGKHLFWRHRACKTPKKFFRSRVRRIRGNTK